MKFLNFMAAKIIQKTGQAAQTRIRRNILKYEKEVFVSMIPQLTFSCEVVSFNLMSVAKLYTVLS